MLVQTYTYGVIGADVVISNLAAQSCKPLSTISSPIANVKSATYIIKSSFVFYYFL
jgi:hypothetical protein